MMVGDGINDAVALTAADVGVAIGAGNTIALEAADVVLRHSKLTVIHTLFALSAATLSRIRINFMWAFLYNLLVIPLAGGVLFPVTGGLTIPPGFAGLSELFSSVPVVLGSLLLFRFVPPALALVPDARGDGDDVDAAAADAKGGAARVAVAVAVAAA